MSRGYKEKPLQKMINEVKSMTRDTLLKDKEGSLAKDPQSTTVCTWHPKFKKLPSILHNKYDIVKNDVHLSRTFSVHPSVACTRKKNLSNFLFKNYISKGCNLRCKL